MMMPYRHAVLIGDPGRAYMPGSGMVRLADYQAPATRELEDGKVKRSGVFTFPGNESYVPLTIAARRRC